MGREKRGRKRWGRDVGEIDRKVGGEREGGRLTERKREVGRWEMDV